MPTRHTTFPGGNHGTYGLFIDNSLPPLTDRQRADLSAIIYGGRSTSAAA